MFVCVHVHVSTHMHPRVWPCVFYNKNTQRGKWVTLLVSHCGHKIRQRDFFKLKRPKLVLSPKDLFFSDVCDFLFLQMAVLVEIPQYITQVIF